MLYDAKHFNIEPNKSVMGFYLGTGFGSAIRIKKYDVSRRFWCSW